MPLENRELARNNLGEDPLWTVKKAILSLLIEGQMCLSDIALTIHQPTDKTKEALGQMKARDTVEIRKTVAGNEKFTIWGISRPRSIRAISSLFSKRRSAE